MGAVVSMGVFPTITSAYYTYLSIGNLPKLSCSCMIQVQVFKIDHVHHTAAFEQSQFSSCMLITILKQPLKSSLNGYFGSMGISPCAYIVVYCAKLV